MISSKLSFGYPYSERDDSDLTEHLEHATRLCTSIPRRDYPSGRVITCVTDSVARSSSAQDVPNNIFYIQGTCTNGVSSLGACCVPTGAIASANIGPIGGSTWLNVAISYTDRLQPNRIQGTSRNRFCRGLCKNILGRRTLCPSGLSCD